MHTSVAIPIRSVRSREQITGLRYEGEWKDGMEHGVGTLTEADGSTFYGFWAEGKMHGEGVRIVRALCAFYWLASTCLSSYAVEPFFMVLLCY